MCKYRSISFYISIWFIHFLLLLQGEISIQSIQYNYHQLSTSRHTLCQGPSVHTRLLFMQLGGEGLHALQVARQILCLRRYLGWSQWPFWKMKHIWEMLSSSPCRKMGALQLVKPADDILENCTGTPVATPHPFRSYHILM